MRILAIDTATRLSGVALLDTVESAWWLRCGTLQGGRGEGLVAVVRQALGETGWAPSALDAIAVAAGPGSYTGLRIGLSVAKTLAWVWDAALVGVGTLEAEAMAARWAAPVVAAALDARRGRVFAALYRVDGPVPQPLVEPRAATVEELAGWLQELLPDRDQAVAAAGDGCRAYWPQLRALAAVRWVEVPPESTLLRPAAVAKVGAVHLAAGRRDDPMALDARYLAATEAERRWQPRS